jgi:signal peptidase
VLVGTHHRGIHRQQLPQPRVQIGDVVTFQPVSDDPTLITHRVVGKSFTSDGTMFVTRGDANGADDEPIEPAQIMGVAMYSVPFVGYVAVWAGSRAQTIVTVVAVALLTYAAVMLLRPNRRRTEAANDGAANDAPTRPEDARAESEVPG